VEKEEPRLLLLFGSRRHHPRPGERLLLSVSILPPSSPAFVLSPDVLIVSRSTLIALFRAPLKAIPKLPSKLPSKLLGWHL
jgi:hypothetical protein